MKKIFRYSMALLLPSFIKNIWLMLRYRCLIHPGAKILFPGNVTIGKGAILGKCSIVAQGPIYVGAKCFINDHVILNSKTGYITIGDHTSINHFSVFFGNGGVEVGSYCAIGLNVQVVKNHVIPPNRGQGYLQITEGKTIIGDSVWLCSNVVVVDGVTVGSYSVVGSNSLVTQDIPDSVIAGGVPAKVLKDRE
jgi:acetyltransferase-like isoleucine patch superfamily enzyme